MYAKTINLLCQGNNVFVKYQALRTPLCYTAAVPKLFLIAYHLWALYFHRVPP